MGYQRLPNRHAHKVTMPKMPLKPKATLSEYEASRNLLRSAPSPAAAALSWPLLFLPHPLFLLFVVGLLFCCWHCCGFSCLSLPICGPRTRWKRNNCAKPVRQANQKAKCFHLLARQRHMRGKMEELQYSLVSSQPFSPRRGAHSAKLN